MSEDKIKAVLKDFGLTEGEAEVYLFLTKHGVMKGTEVAKQLKKDKGQIYHLLKSLQSKGLVEATLEVPARFTAAPFENVVESTIKAKRAEATHMETTKQELLSYWKNINKTRLDLPLEKFMVIEGKQKVYSKISQMITETKNHLSAASTVDGLLQADQVGLYDVASKHPSKSTIQFRFLTELSSQNLSGMQAILKNFSRRGFDFRARNPDFGLSLFPRMVIRDNEETLFFITPRTSLGTQEQNDLCLWTNCKDLVQAFTIVFEDYWHNSTSINAKMTEIKTGKPVPKTQIIDDAETARRKYNAAVQAAEKEITMVTSLQGLIETWKNKTLQDIWAQKGVSVKIMAPITSENIDAAQALSELCEVRHVPLGYLGTTVVDGKHLFQFKNAPPDQETPEEKPYFEKTFYTNDTEYVDKTKIMLNDIWKTAQAPTAFTIDAITAAAIAPNSEYIVSEATKKMLGHMVVEDKTAQQLTAKEVIGKMINAPRYIAPAKLKGVVKTYGCNCQAVVHPPTRLNLPDILFHIYHLEKHSTYGAEDVVIIYPWLKTPTGFAYVLSALITNNPGAIGFWKRVCINSPAEHNVQLAEKNELEVRLHGNTLFAGWTKQIPVIESYIVPPSCLLIEGYGTLKTSAYRVMIPSGYLLKTEGNHQDAFVTYLHPSSKYSGPGTDGAFARDVMMEFIPPRKSTT